MDEWQQTNNKRLLSMSIHKDEGNFCCVVLTNPTEIVITDARGQRFENKNTVKGRLTLIGSST